MVGEICRHDVDGIGKVLPGSSDTRNLRLATKFALGAYFAGDAGDLRGEGIELIHHGIDGVLKLQDLPLHIDGDFSRQIAACDGGGDFSDISHLCRQVGSPSS